MLKLVGGSKMRNRIFTLSQNISTQYTYKWKKINKYSEETKCISPERDVNIISNVTNQQVLSDMYFKKNKISIFCISVKN